MLTRSVRDSAAMLDATHGEDPGAPYAAPPPARRFLEEVGAPPGRLRIAFTRKPLLPAEVDPACVRAVEDAAALLTELGHDVVEDHPQFDAEQVAVDFLTMLVGEVAADVAGWERTLGRTARRGDLENETAVLVRMGHAVPAMWYFDRLDRKRPEPASVRRLVALFGALSVIPVLVLDGVLLGALGDRRPPESSYGGALFTSFIVAALVEEVMKVAVVYAVAWDRRAFDERLDAVVYGARAGLGFALVENVFYLLGQIELQGLIVTWILRAMLAVPGHALWTTIACAGATRRRFDQRGLGLFGGLALAVFLHGTYDAALFLGPPLTLDGHEQVAYALLAVPVLVMIASWWIVKRYARLALRLDDEDAARRPRAAPPPTAPPPGYPPPGYPPPGYPPPGYPPPGAYHYPPGYPWAGGWPRKPGT